MRGLRSTLALLVAFLVIGGYAWFIERERPPASDADAPDPAFADLEADAITTLTVTADTGDVTELGRPEAGADEWTVTAPVDAPADDNAARAIASSLADLEIRRIVMESAADLSPFGLAPSMFTVTFAAAEADPVTVAVGNETPTGGERYAMVGDDGRVVLIPSYVESTLNRSTFDLRDRSILEFTSPDVTRLAIDHAGPPADGQLAGALRFAKADGDWRIVDPLDVRADFGLVEAMVGRVGSGEMIAIVEEAAEGEVLDPFGLDAPRATVTIEAAGETHTLLVGDENPEMTVWARDASRPLVFTIDAALVDDLLRRSETYRQTDLFDFRPFNATALVIERDGRSLRFEQQPPPEGEEDDSDAPVVSTADDVWRRVEPSPAEVERTEMDALLRGLSDLSADSFTERPDGLGLDAPTLRVTATFGDGETEVVVISRTGDTAHGARGDEPGAAAIDPAAVDTALEALDVLDPNASAG